MVPVANDLYQVPIWPGWLKIFHLNSNNLYFFSTILTWNVDTASAGIPKAIEKLVKKYDRIEKKILWRDRIEMAKKLERLEKGALE